MGIHNETRPNRRPLCGDDLRTWVVITKGELVVCTSREKALAFVERRGVGHLNDHYNPDPLGRLERHPNYPRGIA